MIFVRVARDRPIVELFSPLLFGASGDARALERLNQGNRDLRFGRLTCSGGTVLVTYELGCDPFVPELLLQTVATMSELADYLDDRLLAEVGGHRFFEDSNAEPAVAVAKDESDELHPALMTMIQLEQTTTRSLLSR